MSQDYHARRCAEKRVKAKLGFYFHLMVYICVNLLLLVINIASSAEYFWARWPAMGWGVGLLFHGLGVFLSCGRKDALIRRMVEKEMQKKV